MTRYREILRLSNLGLSQQSIADSCGISRKKVNRVLEKAKELNISWSLDANDTDAMLTEKLFPSADKPVASNKRMPDFAYIRKELLRNGVSKKLLWTEYMEGWKDQQINEACQEMAEHYGTAIIPAHVRTPKDKPNAEGKLPGQCQEPEPQRTMRPWNPSMDGSKRKSSWIFMSSGKAPLSRKWRRTSRFSILRGPHIR